MYTVPDINIYASRMGDNCAKYIIDISKEKDMILDNGVNIHSAKEYLHEYLDWKYGKI